MVSLEVKSEENEKSGGGQKNKKEAFKSWQEMRHDATLEAAYKKVWMLLQNTSSVMCHGHAVCSR